MPLAIERPTPVDVTKFNPNNTIYWSDGTFVANESTNGSRRMRLLEGDTVIQFEKRVDGVWNKDGVRISSSTLELALDMTLSAIAGFIETVNISAVTGHQKSFLLHIAFNDEETGFAHAPIAKIPETFVIFSTAVSEIIGTTIGINLGVTPSSSTNIKISLSATEMTADKVVVYAKDAAGTEWNEMRVFIDVPVSSSQSVLDILEGDHVETNVSLVINKKDTSTALINKTITGSLLTPSVTITTKEA